MQHKQGGVTHHHGQDDHIAYLEKPFHEAYAAVHHRAQRLGIRLWIIAKYRRFCFFEDYLKNRAPALPGFA